MLVLNYNSTLLLSYQITYIIYTSINRYSGFRYFCKCSERCFDKDQFSCNEYGKHGKNGCSCKYCRFKKCQESAGMADKWVKSAYSQEPEATINDVKNLIQGSTSDKSGCYKKTENTFPSNSHELYDSQPKRLKHRQSVLRNDEVTMYLVNEKSNYF